MLVFVDESGDPGMSGRVGATEHLVVGLVLFEDDDQAERTDRRIDELRPELKLSGRFEFRFHECHPNVRRRFLRETAAFTWFYLAIVINKTKLWSETFQDPAKLYNYSASLVFENAKPQLRSATVVIDASGGRSFRAELSRYLKRKIDRDGGLIKKIRHEDSCRNNLLQLADMVVGAVGRSVKVGKKDRMDYRKIIKKNELRVQVWP